MSEKKSEFITSLEKELKTHWRNTREERERTHTKALYEKPLKNKNVMTEKRLKI